MQPADLDLYAPLLENAPAVLWLLPEPAGSGDSPGTVRLTWGVT